jgi:hypothetical protein
MVSINRLLYAALGLVGCLAGFEVGQPYLESLNAASGEKPLVRPGDPSVERRLHVVPLRTKAKGRVIEQLAAGRITLFEAAAWFRWLNENPPDCLGESTDGWPGSSPDEKVCRQVLAYVRLEKRRVGADSQAEELADVLEMELANAVARKGGLVLPSLGNGTPGW